MSRKGNPYDNANMESFFKTFKVEEIYVSEYSDEFDMIRSVREYIGKYNKVRLHSALEYLPPVEYQESLAVSNITAGDLKLPVSSNLV